LHYLCDTVASKDLPDLSIIMLINNKSYIVTLMNIEDETVGIAPLEGISDRLNGNSPLPFVFFFKWEINSPLHNVATCIKFYPVS